ncbi:hypothetical protein LTR37_000506 [Vermiconidia calcicola]|uniref:Uncharacterized protein n=1 Tax=Vermiconidia calcicola TaxID=1690605 RepID=A0ACC3NZ64_9PEZI|nr:hypothetical protein LTR37_000506 [Vermiconidia calcicola]
MAPSEPWKPKTEAEEESFTKLMEWLDKPSNFDMKKPDGQPAFLCRTEFTPPMLQEALIHVLDTLPKRQRDFEKFCEITYQWPKIDREDLAKRMGLDVDFNDENLCLDAEMGDIDYADKIRAVDLSKYPKFRRTLAMMATLSQRLIKPCAEVAKEIGIAQGDIERDIAEG